MGNPLKNPEKRQTGDTSKNGGPSEQDIEPKEDVADQSDIEDILPTHAEYMGGDEFHELVSP